MNSQRWNNDDNLTRALKDLASETRGMQAPSRVESAVMDAFRRRKQSRIAARPAFRWIVPVSVAAAVSMMMVAGLFIWGATVAPEAVQPASFSPPLFQGQNNVEAVNLALQSQIPFAIHRNDDSKPERAAELEEGVTQFIPLVVGMPSNSYQIVRVRMARSALAQFGFPVNEQRSYEPVDADFVVGEDGQPRAIRLVNLKY